MTVRQYWVHYDEPMHPEPAPAPAPAPGQKDPRAEWESILNALLDLIEPHAPLYRAALHLLAGHRSPLPPLPPLPDLSPSGHG